MGNYISKAGLVQSINIPTPTLTEKNLPDQTGKVHIVTGGYTGLGEQLTRILYSKNAKVYIAGRNPEKSKAAVQRITEAFPTSTGQLVSLQLDLSDLSTIKASAEEFLAKEARLDVLVNNAGVMFTPDGMRTAQGHDIQFGTNCLGAHLFTKLLHPILKKTAASSDPNSVRIIWPSSLTVQVFSPTGGVAFDSNSAGKPQELSSEVNYAQSKAGNIFLAIQTQKLLQESGVVSVSFNPGNLRTELLRHTTWWSWIFGVILYPSIYGAYTELWAGWSPEVTVEKGIVYVAPWGRDGSSLVRRDILDAIEKEGIVDRFWQYCEEETRAYA